MSSLFLSIGGQGQRRPGGCPRPNIFDFAPMGGVYLINLGKVGGGGGHKNVNGRGGHPLTPLCPPMVCLHEEEEMAKL